FAAGKLAKMEGDLDTSEHQLTEALVAARGLADRHSEGDILAWRSSVHWQWRATEVALRFAEEALRLGQEVGDQEVIAFAYHNLGIDWRQARDATRSVGALEEGLRVYRRLGNQRCVANVMTDLGLSLQEAGENDRAKSVLRESLHELRATGERRYVIFALLGLARIYHSQGEPRLAVRLLCAA